MSMRGHHSTPNRLLPYATILAATSGDAGAMDAVLEHYDRYINKLATRPLLDESGATRTMVDEALRARLALKLVMGVLSFRVI